VDEAVAREAAGEAEGGAVLTDDEVYPSDVEGEVPNSVRALASGFCPFGRNLMHRFCEVRYGHKAMHLFEGD